MERGVLWSNTFEKYCMLGLIPSRITTHSNVLKALGSPVGKKSV